MIAKYEAMSISELETEQRVLTAQRKAIKGQAKILVSVLDQKLESARVSKILGREVQVVGASSVVSAEKIGEINAV